MQQSRSIIMADRKWIPSLPAPLYVLGDVARQGFQSFVATQKILLDLVAQQNSLVLGFARERLSYTPFGIRGLIEFAGQSAATFIAAQKILLELAGQENSLALQGVKQGLGLTGTPAALADIWRGGVEAFVAMQKKFLDLAAEQSQAVVQAVLEGSPMDAAAGAAQRAQQGLKTFVDTQKHFLDLVARHMSPGDGHKALKPAEHKRLTELAKDSVDAFVEAEKQLLDLAVAQVAATIKAARPEAPEPSTNFGDLARRGIVNLVNAQKALIDVAAKPFLPAPPRPKKTPPHHAAPAARKARRTRKARPVEQAVS
jgi:hypothetical protein